MVATGLLDEHRDRRYLIVDAVDGQSHYVDIGENSEDHRRGSILRIASPPSNCEQPTALSPRSRKTGADATASISNSPMIR